MSFTDFWLWLSTGKYTEDSGLAQKGMKIFPQFGPLISYLLTVDYAYTGLISQPSMAEMGHILKRIDAGAINGLRLLGSTSTTPGSSFSAEHIQTLFEEFYKYLDSSLTLEEKVSMGFDVFVVEHLLCKISRLSSHFLE
jgi:hypothetical protein